MRRTGGAMILVIFMVSLLTTLGITYLNAAYINEKVIEIGNRNAFKAENEIEFIEYEVLNEVIEAVEKAKNEFGIEKMNGEYIEVNRKIELSIVNINWIKRESLRMTEIKEPAHFYDVYIEYNMIKGYLGDMYCNLLYEEKEGVVKLVDIQLQKKPFGGDVN
jgi:hypothetical protein